MTKQVFDQIAEGLRKAAETPPAWAIEKAREMWMELFSAEGHAEGQSVLDAIARALAEADKAATERAAKIADALPGWQQPRDVASAIRGAGHE